MIISLIKSILGFVFNILNNIFGFFYKNIKFLFDAVDLETKNEKTIKSIRAYNKKRLKLNDEL